MMSARYYNRAPETLQLRVGEAWLASSVTCQEQQAQWAKFYAQLTADQKRVTDDIVRRAPDNSGQQIQWAEELVALVDLLLRREPGAPPWPVVRSVDAWRRSRQGPEGD